MAREKLVRRFKDEAVAVYAIEGGTIPDDFVRYTVSTRATRDLMNYPEVINCDFTNLMQNGITNALKGINVLERISEINSRSVNVYHILRGGLNFRVVDALKKAFGYKWHSSSYTTSERVLKDGRYEVSEDSYRKFVVPDNATVYTADIVASGVSLDNGVGFIYNYMKSKRHRLRNFVFITIGCVEAERVLDRWHKTFKETFPEYERTFVIYLEGRFGLANENTPFANKIPYTDLIKSYREGALLTPEYEHSQFDRVITALEACAIYDGGKKGFEPINHITDVLEFWEKQQATAQRETWSIREEYERRFPLDMYADGPAGLARAKQEYWDGVGDNEYKSLYARYRWLWTDERRDQAGMPGSFISVCEKKIKYLRSLLPDDTAQEMTRFRPPSFAR